MAIEIERKFKVTDSNYKSCPSHRISQGYICSESDRVVRIRIIDTEAFITIKNATIGFARNEYEYPIPVKDAEEMLQNTCQQPIIEKRRYIYKGVDYTWEIDEFYGDNEGLVIAEIELPKRDATFELPNFIGEEVTDDARYYNAMLFKHPYSEWKETN